MVKSISLIYFFVIWALFSKRLIIIDISRGLENRVMPLQLSQGIGINP